MKQYDHTSNIKIIDCRSNKPYCDHYCDLDPNLNLKRPSKFDRFAYKLKKYVAKFLFLIYKAALCKNLILKDFSHDAGASESNTKVS